MIYWACLDSYRFSHHRIACRSIGTSHFTNFTKNGRRKCDWNLQICSPEEDCFDGVWSLTELWNDSSFLGSEAVRDSDVHHSEEVLEKHACITTLWLVNTHVLTIDTCVYTNTYISIYAYNLNVNKALFKQTIIIVRGRFDHNFNTDIPYPSCITPTLQITTSLEMISTPIRYTNHKTISRYHMNCLHPYDII